MYCSLEFSLLGLPVATHSLWDAKQTNCMLRMFTDQEQARAFIGDLSDDKGKKDFENCIRVLPDLGDESAMVEIEGDAALSLTSALVTLREKIQVLPRISNKSELMGFWGPPDRRKTGRGMVMWFHRNEYHVVIPYSQEQAEQTIRNLSSWLGRERRGRLAANIKRWNSPRQSPQSPQVIEGIVAELLCKSSIAMKIRQAMEKEEKTLN